MKEKPHYILLDGLRGVAALMVLVFHVFDICSSNIIPHGYLAVDLFFVLSGFVIGYAYDDRWPQGLTAGQFFRRRLIRLHPMVLVGGLLGGLVFLMQGHTQWDGTVVPLLWSVVAILCSMLLLPALPGSPIEVRGFGEYFPLNGPFWSLFYEYIGNVLYVLLLRRLSNRMLSAVATLSGACVLYFCLTEGYIGLGWSAANGGWWYGLVRMLFPYSVGMLMARCFHPVRVRHTFLVCSLLIFAAGLAPAFSLPWANGLYDFLCAAFLFPAIVWLAASHGRTGEQAQRLCRFLGDISYPLYAIHYPFMLILFGCLGFNGDLIDPHFVATQWPLALAIVVCCPLLAWLLFKYYDQPFRGWLSRKWGK